MAPHSFLDGSSDPLIVFRKGLPPAAPRPRRKLLKVKLKCRSLWKQVRGCSRRGGRENLGKETCLVQPRRNRAEPSLCTCSPANIPLAVRAGATWTDDNARLYQVLANIGYTTPNIHIPVYLLQMVLSADTRCHRDSRVDGMPGGYLMPTLYELQPQYQRLDGIKIMIQLNGITIFL
jgi:hypothetical protein